MTKSQRHLSQHNPATGEVWVQIPDATREDAARAIEAAHARYCIEAGMCHINDSSVNDEPHIPFGGMKNSGVGRHAGQASVDTFTELRWITLERGHRIYPPPFNEPL